MRIGVGERITVGLGIGWSRLRTNVDHVIDNTSSIFRITDGGIFSPDFQLHSGNG